MEQLRKKKLSEEYSYAADSVFLYSWYQSDYNTLCAPSFLFVAENHSVLACYLALYFHFMHLEANDCVVNCSNALETLSTLRFAQRAKFIRNNVRVSTHHWTFVFPHIISAGSVGLDYL